MSKRKTTAKGKAAQAPAELTREEIAAEDAFLEGVPRFNIGAFVLPGIWGPVHGLWIAILFYPLWLFADNTFYAAYTERTPLAIAVAAIVFAILLAVHILFGILSQPYAWHRAHDMGVSKQTYLKRQRIWAVAMVVLGVAALAFATYYNILVRPTTGA